MEMQRLEGAGLEKEDMNSILDLLNLTCLLDIQVGMNLHYNSMRCYYYCPSCISIERLASLYSLRK